MTAPQYYAVQVLALRREQARMGELEDPVREALATNPERAAWRAGLAALLNETGRTEEARAEFEVLARDGFAWIPRDGDWKVVTALSADLAHAFGDLEHDTLISGARVNNPASRRVLEKCGFQWTGVRLSRIRAINSAAPIDRFRLDRGLWASLKSWGHANRVV